MDDTTKHLEKFRSRWRRWLGQLCKDENYTRLLDSNYQSVLWKIRRNHDLETERSWNILTVKAQWLEAIAVASLDELQQIDIAFVNEKLRM